MKLEDCGKELHNETYLPCVEATLFLPVQRSANCSSRLQLVCSPLFFFCATLFCGGTAFPWAIFFLLKSFTIRATYAQSHNKEALRQTVPRAAVPRYTLPAPSPGRSCTAPATLADILVPPSTFACGSKAFGTPSWEAVPGMSCIKPCAPFGDRA